LPFVGEFMYYSSRVEVHDFPQFRLTVSVFKILRCNKKKGFQGRLSKRATNFWYFNKEKRQTHILMPESIWVSAIIFDELLMIYFSGATGAPAIPPSRHVYQRVS
jgi:hypothetical protein